MHQLNIYPPLFLNHLHFSSCISKLTLTPGYIARNQNIYCKKIPFSCVKKGSWTCNLYFTHDINWCVLTRLAVSFILFLASFYKKSQTCMFLNLQNFDRNLRYTSLNSLRSSKNLGFVVRMPSHSSRECAKHWYTAEFSSKSSTNSFHKRISISEWDNEDDDGDDDICGNNICG